MAEREPKKKTSIGGTGSGKTYQNMKFIKEVYSNPKLPNARKTLIYDTNMEFKDITPIAPEDIPAFVKQKTIEIRRVLPLSDDGKELGMDGKYELLCDIIDNYGFRNGLLYLEDINNYVTNTHSKHLVNLLTTNRHKLLDIFINLQTFRALPPRLWGNINILTIHKTNDSPFQTKIKDQISGQLKPLGIAYILVEEKNRQLDPPRFFCTLDMGTSKITGDFILSEFIDACEKYLLLNKITVTDFCKMNSLPLSPSEKKSESLAIARSRLIGEMIHNYNGNVRLKNKK